MRIELRIDNYVYLIDSRDPDLLARWLVEQFAGREWTPATVCQAQCWPSWGGGGMTGQPETVDWVKDSRYSAIWSIKSPRDMLAKMQATLDEIEPRRGVPR